MKRITACGTAWTLALGLLLSMATTTLRAQGEPAPPIQCQIGLLTPETLAGINPATGAGWKIGDPYRLVFISSGVVDPRQPNALGDLNEIGTWNSIAQQFANHSDQPNLAEAAWRVLGSSETVDARDNTSTNPAVGGGGHPILLIDGATVVAANFNELWSGSIRNIIDRTENLGQTIDDVPPGPWPFTGTQPDGARHGAPYVLRHISGTSTIRQGEAGTTQGWIDRSGRPGNPPAASRVPQTIYVMSEALTVQGSPGTSVTMK